MEFKILKLSKMLVGTRLDRHVPSFQMKIIKIYLALKVSGLCQDSCHFFFASQTFLDIDLDQRDLQKGDNS